jgi:hypothetical protein
MLLHAPTRGEMCLSGITTSVVETVEGKVQLIGQNSMNTCCSYCVEQADSSACKWKAKTLHDVTMTAVTVM